MDTTIQVAVEEKAGKECTLPISPRCPQCAARMFEARGQLKCVRCNFTLCAGCEVD